MDTIAFPLFLDKNDNSAPYKLIVIFWGFRCSIFCFRHIDSKSDTKLDTNLTSFCCINEGKNIVTFRYESKNQYFCTYVCP